MRSALRGSILLFFVLGVAAQTATRSTAAPARPLPPELSPIISEIQRVAQATNADIGRLHIEKWKTDSSQRQQMEQVANSLQRNIRTAIPSLINEVQDAPASVSQTFKLYHNLNVVYEFLNSLVEAAGSYGQDEEYEPLSADASALDKVRQSLSGYIEQSAVSLEAQLVHANAAAQKQQPLKKVIVDNTPAAKKTRKATTQTSSAPAQ
ncbi:MAG TPA: hypothetical protein VN176_01030 [Verrucomicrobiae bacterium]|jgi:hypothetical protein|nr:hypothetical protein [Verrucomicrobiae bacterium]